MSTNAVKNPRMPIFRDRLNELRGNLSYAKFAEKLGMSRATMGFYLSGERVPNAVDLKRIAEICSVSSDWLIGLDNAPTHEAADICRKTGLSNKALVNLISLNKYGPVQSLLALNALLEHEMIWKYFSGQKSEQEEKAPIINLLYEIGDYLHLSPDTTCHVRRSKDGETIEFSSSDRILFENASYHVLVLAERIALDAIEGTLELLKNEVENNGHNPETRRQL